MAILSKIRDRSMFLILIVGLALFAFVLNPSSIQKFFSSSKLNSVGSVNGEEISREEFASQVEAYRSKNGNKITQMQAVNAVWNSILGDKIFESQLKKAGIVVGEKDIWDAMVALPEIQKSPLFKNEINLFDEERLKEYIANMEDEAKAGNTKSWSSWLATEKNIKQNLQRQAYTSLVTIGLGASSKEGENNYLFNNTKMDAQYVLVPYSSIPDSLSTVSKGEMQKYIENNPKRFKSVATSSLKYVQFNIEPSELDDADVKKVVASFINDREEYSNAAKTTVKVDGFKNTTNNEEFLNDNKSDLSIDNSYLYKNQLPASVSKEIFNASIGAVVGPYKDKGYYKISKIVEVLQLPDSVKSRHIIIPYKGTTRSSSTKTKEAAKKTVDSIFALVKNSKTKFIEIANEVNSDGTKGKGGDIGWIRKDQAFSPSFDKDFADFIYKNKSGSIAIVETAFGFHIIKIDEQTKYKKAVKLVTFARLIEASETTENSIFEKAETLAANLDEGKKIDDIAKENGYKVRLALSLKALDENVPGLGAQRHIVTWAFNNSREIGDSKRFDLDVASKRSYAVVVLNNKMDEDGLILNSKIIAQVRPEIVNKKKAALIKKKMQGVTLEEIAKNSNTTVHNASSVTLGSPLISGVGNEPSVVGAMSSLEINKVSDKIEGKKGVFVVKVLKREEPIKLENYETFRNTEATKIKGRTYQLYKVLKETANIKDNRSKFF